MERLTAEYVGRRLDKVEEAIDQVQRTSALLGSDQGPQRLALRNNLAPFDILKRVALASRVRLNIQSATLPILESHQQFEKTVLGTITQAQDAQRRLDRLWQQYPDYDQEYLTEALNDPAKEEKNRLARQIVKAQMTPLLRHKSRRIRRSDTSYKIHHEVSYEVPLPNFQKLQTKSPSIAFIVEELKKATAEQPLDFRAMLRPLTGTNDYQSYTVTQGCMLDTEKALQKKGYRLERRRGFLQQHRYGTSGSRVYLHMRKLELGASEEIGPKADSKPSTTQEKKVDPRLTLRQRIDEAIVNIEEVRRLQGMGVVADTLLHQAEKAYGDFIKTQPLSLVAESIISYLQQIGMMKSQIIPRIMSALTYTNNACTLSTETLAQELYGATDKASLFKANGYMYSLRNRLARLRLGLDITAKLQPESTMKHWVWRGLRKKRPLLAFQEPTAYYLDFAA